MAIASSVDCEGENHADEQNEEKLACLGWRRDMGGAMRVVRRACCRRGGGGCRVCDEARRRQTAAAFKVCVDKNRKRPLQSKISVLKRRADSSLGRRSKISLCIFVIVNSN